MKNKALKKLKKSQRKLKKAFANLGKAGKQAENPAWVTALAAMAGAITTALADRDKRGRLGDIALEAKDKAVGLLTTKKEERAEAAPPLPKEEELQDVEDIHLENEPEMTEAHGH